jgi:cytochrome P450
MPKEDALVSSDADVRAILADPAYVVPSAPPAAQTGTLAWLRAHVTRFCEGEAHDRRRALAEHEIAALDPAGLREAAAAMTAAELARHPNSEPFDVMPLARRVPAAALAAGLGLRADDIAAAVDAVLGAVSGYLNPDLAGPDADSSVALLAKTFGPGEPEPLANRIGLLMQACDATAALIGNALIAAFASDDSVEEIIAGTLVDDPPTLRTRRISPDGELVTVDISNCTFGAGRRPCPGAEQARALAAGVLDAVLARCELADQQIGYLSSPNLRMAASLLVIPRQAEVSR